MKQPTNITLARRMVEDAILKCASRINKRRLSCKNIRQDAQFISVFGRELSVYHDLHERLSLEEYGHARKRPRPDVRKDVLNILQAYGMEIKDETNGQISPYGPLLQLELDEFVKLLSPQDSAPAAAS